MELENQHCASTTIVVDSAKSHPKPVEGSLTGAVHLHSLKVLPCKVLINYMRALLTSHGRNLVHST